MNMKKINMWAVVWRDEVKELYGVPNTDHGLIVIDHEHSQLRFNMNSKRKGRPKMRYADLYPFFETFDEAEAYRAGNNDWVSVLCDISYSQPTD